jgi:hypothetical protein
MNTVVVFCGSEFGATPSEALHVNGTVRLETGKDAVKVLCEESTATDNGDALTVALIGVEIQSGPTGNPPAVISSIGSEPVAPLLEPRLMTKRTFATPEILGGGAFVNCNTTVTMFAP